MQRGRLAAREWRQADVHAGEGTGELDDEAEAKLAEAIEEKKAAAEKKEAVKEEAKEEESGGRATRVSKRKAEDQPTPAKEAEPSGRPKQSCS